MPKRSTNAPFSALLNAIASLFSLLSRFAESVPNNMHTTKGARKEGFLTNVTLYLTLAGHYPQLLYQ